MLGQVGDKDMKLGQRFQLVRGERGPAGPGPEGWEDDLFAGLPG